MSHSHFLVWYRKCYFNIWNSSDCALHICTPPGMNAFPRRAETIDQRGSIISNKILGYNVPELELYFLENYILYRVYSLYSFLFYYFKTDWPIQNDCRIQLRKIMDRLIHHENNPSLQLYFAPTAISKYQVFNALRDAENDFEVLGSRTSVHSTSIHVMTTVISSCPGTALAPPVQPLTGGGGGGQYITSPLPPAAPQPAHHHTCQQLEPVAGNCLMRQVSCLE